MRFSRRPLIAAFAAILVSSLAAYAANLSFSTGTGFIPGPRMVDGSDLNVMVSAINTLQAQVAGNPALLGTGVNQVSVSGAATGVDPVITVGGASSDTNIGLLIAGKGTAPLHLGGTLLSNASVRVPTVASAVNEITLQGAITTAEPLITVGGTASDTNIGIVISGKGTGAMCMGGTTCANSSHEAPTVASAVNHILTTGAITTAVPTITTGGSGADTNIGMAIAGKGTGAVLIGGTTTTLAGLQVAQTASRVNDVVITPGATGTSPTVQAGGAGADANVNLGLLATGTTGLVLNGTSTTCSGTTTATCSAQRFVVSITGLTTAAAGTTSAAMTVTNTFVASSATRVNCSVNGYAGTGVPIATTIIPGTGSVSLTITNVAASGALNATVPVACLVY